MRTDLLQSAADSRGRVLVASAVWRPQGKCAEAKLQISGDAI